jgi:hypothetical protein
MIEPLPFCAYESSRGRPNVVVDGSPNDATVLALTHWPGIAQPPGCAADLSAQMAFRFVRAGAGVVAEVVTNNHFDQDGLVSVCAFVDPDRALDHEALLTDVAAAGDFATYRFRDAARVSMAIWTYADARTSPIASQLTGPYDEQCAMLYETLLPRLVPMVLDPQPYRDLWGDEDDRLTATEAALARGAITIEELAPVDLALVRVAATEPDRRAHRFGSDEHAGAAHPMALHNATSCLRVLEVHGRRYVYTDRYETWVQYRSRRPLPRVDLRPLAAVLSDADRGGSEWRATDPGSLVPELRSPEESSLDEATVISLLTAHLAAAPSAWDPYAGA